MNPFRRRIYGPNLIDVPVKPYMQLLFGEVRLKTSAFYTPIIVFFYESLECLK